MKRITSIFAGLLAAGILFSTAGLSAADVNFPVSKILQINVLPFEDRAVLLMAEGAGGCSQTAFATINLNRNGSKALFQAAMAAFLAGRSVIIRANGCIGNQHSINRIQVKNF